MKPKVVNPIPYQDLDPEIRSKLDRYIRKVGKATGERWYIACIYKSTTWYRAQLRSLEGSHVYVWYRPRKNCWTAIHSPLKRRYRDYREEWLLKATDEQVARVIAVALRPQKRIATRSR